EAVPAVLLPRRHPQPRRAGDARVDPRGRRARLLAVARLRRRVRQPGPAGRVRLGDGEAETGPLATGWHGNKLLNPATDGVVLPILHLNGYKIANPTLLARIPEEELVELMRGYGHTPYLFTAGFDDEPVRDIHRRFAQLLDDVLDHISRIKAAAAEGSSERPLWPMIVFRTPKGWTCPDEIDGHRTEGSWRSHQVPLANARDTPEHLQVLADWLRSYRPEELFDDGGALRPDLAALAPRGDLR